ncbi:hypothetical protein [Oricola nitratireducens]|uniref:hypothetical protein n=1 Tax=Oricola nitratireducens TaxID=2775868 RepID=UPI0018665EC5|nr:hypothetical protein [Oricola nitratireducens]
MLENYINSLLGTAGRIIAGADEVEAAAMLFEAALVLDHDWHPSAILRCVRSQLVADGLSRGTAEAMLLQATRKRLDLLDLTFARSRKARLGRQSCSLCPGGAAHPGNWS